jgi:hypothetical protein
MKPVPIAITATVFAALSFSAGLLAPGRSQVSQPKMNAAPPSQCICYISANNISNQPTPAGALYALFNSNENQAQCQSHCASAPSQPSLQATADALCTSTVNAPNGATIRTYYRFGSGTFQLATVVGVLTNTPFIPSTQWKCPATWNSNTSNQLGGITTDQRCKKLVGSIAGVPAPANGTQLGAWGFTWENGVWAYGTSANGGAAFHPSTPAQCHF